METLTHIKIFVTAICAVISGFLGVLYVPVFLMVGCNIIDYITGLMAAPYRNMEIDSYKGIRGITKKVCMWLLVVVGCVIDTLINYTSQSLGMTFRLNYTIAAVVAIWIICNEIISILENITDMGVVVPKWLKPIVDKIKSQVDKEFDKEE